MLRVLLCITLVIGCSLAAAGTAGAARLFKWTDGDGNVSYHDRAPPADAGYQVESKDFKTHKTSGADDAERRLIAIRHPVVLYVASKCASCDLARDYLKRKAIPFAEKNVEIDPDANEQLRAVLGSLAVPTITIGKEGYVKGFVVDALQQELKKAGYLPDDEDMEEETGEP